VLEIVANGSSNAEIGERLFIQEGTVKNHIHNILRKLDLRDRGQAALWYSQWQRMQNIERKEMALEGDGHAEAEAGTIRPSEYVQQISSRAHPRGMIFAAIAIPKVRAGLERTLELLCRQLEWPVGHVLILDETPESLASCSIWALPSSESFPELQTAMALWSVPVRESLAGVPLGNGDPIWITDVQRENGLPLADAARKENIHSGLFIPLVMDETVIGMLTFFSTRIEAEPPEAVIEELIGASIEVSGFIEEIPAMPLREGDGTK
jgi:hypothetical protein